MKTKGKTKLEDLEVKKIDAVDIGADQKANILIIGNCETQICNMKAVIHNQWR